MENFAQGLYGVFHGVTAAATAAGCPQLCNSVCVCMWLGWKGPSWLRHRVLKGSFTYEVLVDVYRDIRIDELLIPQSAKCHRVARLEVRGP